MSSENKPVMPPERIEETETEEEIRQEEAAKGKGERAFEVFCAAIFLGMIGLVFFNAFLRYVFRSSFAPSEEWARFLFIYITFIGGIEAFYRHKHIAVDMFVNMISGTSRKAVDIVASLFMLAALVLLLFGGASDAGHLFRRYRREHGLHQRDASRHGLCRDHHPLAGYRAADPHARQRVQHRA